MGILGVGKILITLFSAARRERVADFVDEVEGAEDDGGEVNL